MSRITQHATRRTFEQEAGQRPTNKIKIETRAALMHDARVASRELSGFVGDAQRSVNMANEQVANRCDGGDGGGGDGDDYGSNSKYAQTLAVDGNSRPSVGACARL